MQEEALAPQVSSTQADPAATHGGGAKPVSEPAAHPFSETIQQLMQPERAPEAASSTPPVASAVPSDDALRAVRKVAAEHRRFFDFRRAMQAAMRVLTKERSFLPVEATSSVAGSETAVASNATAHEGRPATSRPPGLSGHTSTVAMPEVLGFLAQLRKSGTLWIWNEHDHYRVQLVDGNVTFARSESRRQGSLLGEILVSQGAIDAVPFEEFMAQKRGPGPMGDALISAGLVSKEALCAAVQHQAQRVFDRAFGLEDAYFSFDASEAMATPEGVRISVTQMLFESARERDESERRQAGLAAKPPGE
ncbi:MAG TPA: DUF4388 domain-containing protein [Planctomycetota bacterium]|nr:DUF4388 domain-containing protein [Planctomycetota bacterium]